MQRLFLLFSVQLAVAAACAVVEVAGVIDAVNQIFKKHDLTKLGRSKPELLESKMTKATSRVFRQVEEDSRELDEADDPSDELPYITN